METSSSRIITVFTAIMVLTLCLLIANATFPESTTAFHPEDVADQFIWPIDEDDFLILQGFGNTRMEKPGYHAATDFGVYRFDVPVRTIANGWVENFTPWSNGITIKHIMPNQEIVYSWYEHLASPPQNNFEVGQFLPIGTVIGVAGEVGWAPSGINLHLEIKKVPDMNEGYLYDLSNHYNPFEFILSRMTYNPDAPTHCIDGTVVDTCSATRPLHCIEGGFLVENAFKCGCDGGVAQADGTCSKTDSGIIVDNEDPGFHSSGDWTVTTMIMGHYGANYLVAPAGAAPSTATWTPEIPTFGYYDIYGWWRGPLTYHPNTRATSAPVEIHHAGQTDIVHVDFSNYYKEWKYLGKFYFEQGNSNSIVLSGSQQGEVVADAFRFVPASGTPPKANFAGTPNTGPAPLTVEFSDTSPGDVTSWLWDFGDGSTSTAQNPVYQYLNAGVYTVTLTVSGSAGSAGETKTDFIVVTGQGVYEQVVDNDTPGFTTVGTWYTSTHLSGYYGSDYRWAYDGDGSTRATWTFQLPAASHYLVQAWWPALSTRSPNAPYTIYHAGGASTIRADQRVNGGQWNNLGTFYFAAGSTKVILSNDASNLPAADAVRIVSVSIIPLKADYVGTPTTGRAPLTVEFTDASTGDVTSWQWDFGDGSTSTAQNPVHQYLNAGFYTVTLTVSGSGGSQSETKESYIVVTDGGSPHAGGSGGSGCFIKTIYLSPGH